MGDDEVDADAAVRTDLGPENPLSSEASCAGATSFMESRLTPAQTAPGVTTLPA
jgi:hypothetical protein